MTKDVPMSLDTIRSPDIISAKLNRLDRTIEAQKAFLHRVPDPDTRDLAESNLITLVEMRDAVREVAAGSRKRTPDLRLVR